MTGSQGSWVRAVLAAAFVLVAGAGCRTAPETRAENLGKEVGEKFKYIDELAQLDSTQIKLGELAEMRSSDPAVQELGKRIAADHRAHLETLSSFVDGRLAEAQKLSEAGSQEGLGGSGLQGEEQAYRAVREKLKSYENESSRTEVRDEKTIQRLSALSGSAFDRDFVKHVRESQQEGKRFVEQGYERFNSDPNFAALLAKTTPVLEQHISMASAIRK